jgi:predicted N-acyltransferase
MHFAILDGLGSVPAAAWNALAPGHPFLSHEFLSALERTGCVGGGTGWVPQYLVAHDRAGPGGRLLGAVPLYLKEHSYGEFVFDWAWAGAASRIGIEYYPKLVAAVPFTPVTGPRILVSPDADTGTRLQLIDAARAHARRIRASSLHWLFADQNDSARLEERAFMVRVGYQFHWNNNGCADFDDFLSGFSAQKRKKVKRERRFVRDAGVELEVLAGEAILPHHWQAFYRFYRATIDKHGAAPYLTREFFQEIGRTSPQSLVLVLARHGTRYVAGALNFRSANALYGRYWGALEEFHSLHFETCYYQAIDYCLREGLQRFEAGAQGEHKLSRGFLPVPTYSAHWIGDARLARAIEDFVARERNAVTYYIDELNEHSPFKKDPP